MLVDACREDMGSGRSVVSLNRLYEEKFDAAHVSAVFYATKQGGYSYEDPTTDYGAFSKYIIDGLQGNGDRDSDGLVTFRELSTYVEDELGDWARTNGYMQRPYTRILGEQSGDLALTVIASIDDIAGIRMVPIPGGSFRMGCISGYGVGYERPVHEVTLSSFEMSVTEITQGQYKAVMGKNLWSFEGDDLPVEGVNWNVAMEFCKRFSEKTGEKFSLPTEAEWEYACRAGTETKYYTGDSENDLARAGWYGYDSGNSEKKAHSVGLKEPNAWGLYDMHGNIAEWCNDWFNYNYYSSSPSTDPIGPSSGSERVIRSGKKVDPALWCRSAMRSNEAPDSTHENIGFRIVRRP